MTAAVTPKAPECDCAGSIQTPERKRVGVFSLLVCRTCGGLVTKERKRP